MPSRSFVRESADAIVQALLELEANAALNLQDPAFIRSLLQRIHELENVKLPSRKEPKPITGEND